MLDESLFLQLVENMDVPEDVHEFVRESILVLPGETEEDYIDMLCVMVMDVDPQTGVEWLCVIDLASLWWEIQRYRKWKIAIIKVNRANAVADALYKSDPNYLLLGPQPTIQAQAKVDAAKWHKDDNHRGNLNVRLKAHGFDAQGINAHAFVQGLIPLTHIERLLAAARSQINITLRGINYRREFSRRAKQAIKQRLAENSVENNEVSNEVNKPVNNEVKEIAAE